MTRRAARTSASSNNLAPWWELALVVPEGVAEDVGFALVEGGALGVEEQSARAPAPELGAWAGDVADPQPRTSYAPGMATLLASFDGALAEDDVLARGRTAFADGDLRIRRRDDTEWAESWKQYFVPIRFGRRLVVAPSWDVTFKPERDDVVVRLEPGLAFGTGQHATTALCLEFLEEAEERGRVLDVGCGSGILAIAAVKLGFDDALAIDNDPFAVDVTKENCRDNRMGTRVRASGEDVARVKGRFDWVIANIIAPVLDELRDPIVARVGKQGRLLLSGVLTTQVDEITRRYVGKGELALRATKTRGDWAALLFSRP